MASADIPVPRPPSLEAKAYLLMDYQSVRIIAQQIAMQRLEPASLTKLVTAYIVFKALKEGRLRLNQVVPVSEKAWLT